MSHNGDYAWRCASDDNKFCPPEGCPKFARNAAGDWVEYGCARKRGWAPGMESPRECQGLLPAAEAAPTGEGA